jgi:hypothetical protein
MNLNLHKTIHISKPVVTALLLSFYSLVFILTPYWLVPQSFPIIFIILTFTIGAGLVWSHLSTESLEFNVEVKQWLYFIILMVGMIAINWRPLLSEIGWRGDEDFHIKAVLSLFNQVRSHIGWVIYNILFFILYLYISKRKPKGANFLYILTIIVNVLYILLSDIFPKSSFYSIMRYPYINYWGDVIIPLIASRFISPYHEVLFRIIPFISAVAIAWMFQRKLKPNGPTLFFLLGLSVATIPILLYYSSILYLELPAVFLMFYVCLKVKTLIFDDVYQLRHNPAWYALIVIGFIKETTVPFLFCLLLVRIWATITNKILIRPVSYRPVKIFRQNNRSEILKILTNELIVTFSTLFPVVLYIFLRSIFATTRSFTPNLTNLWMVQTYSAIGQSLVQQFGLFLIFFIIGCIILLRKKETFSAGFYLLVFLVTLLFFGLDNWQYAGYSRFNLYILPVILAGSCVLFNQIVSWKKIISTTIVLVVITINLLMSPIFPDGSKVPLWGNYNYDTSEHYYPYQDALYWLKHTYPYKLVVFTGLYYRYYSAFYFNKLSWHPNYKMILSDKGLSQNDDFQSVQAMAKEYHYQIVLFQLQGKELPKLGVNDYFKYEKEFCNMAHCLVVLYR